MPIELDSGALRLKPSTRVRLHGRSRLPDLALAFTLATTVLFAGATFLTPASSEERAAGAASNAASLVEMRSAATNATVVPIRTGVRVVGAEAAFANSGGEWAIRAQTH